MEKLRDRVREWNRRRKVAQLDRQAQRERDKDRLVVMGIAKNEGRNIDEWIEHYYWQGASKIVLIDNGSTDDTVARAEGWKARGASIEILISPQRHLQTEHYKRAFRSLHLERDYEWLLVADLDEFWFCKNGDTVASALQDFSGLDLIYVNWTHFGSDGHIAHPDSLRTNLLTRRPELASHGVTKWAGADVGLARWERHFNTPPPFYFQFACRLGQSTVSTESLCCAE